MNEQFELFEPGSLGSPKPDRKQNIRQQVEPSRFNLFLATLPDPPTTSQVLDLRMRLLKDRRASGTCRPADKLHVSLFGFRLPFVPEEAVLALQHVAGMVARHTAPFEITLDRICSWRGKPENRHLVLTQSKDGNPDLVNLMQALVTKWIEDVGSLKEGKDTPHMTLLYGKHDIQDEPVDAVTWKAKEIILVLSEWRKPYQVLGQWPLGGERTYSGFSSSIAHVSLKPGFFIDAAFQILRSSKAL